MMNIERSVPEIFVGLTLPLGVDSQSLTAGLSEVLRSYGLYHCQTISLVERIPKTDEWAAFTGTNDWFKRYQIRMQVGNQIRALAENTLKEIEEDLFWRNGILGALAAFEVYSSRERDNNGSPVAKPGQAFIFKSLKRPEEIRALREIYGRSYYTIAVHESSERRKSRLEDLIRPSQPGNHSEKLSRAEMRAKELIEVDQLEYSDSHGQRVADAFAHADLFVDCARDPKAQIERFFALLHCDPTPTPTPDEYCMFLAWGAARRSGDLSRQVGAVIADKRGTVLATGTNEVPSALGGVYWETDKNDQRDLKLPSDTSTNYKIAGLCELLQKALPLLVDPWPPGKFSNQDELRLFIENTVYPGVKDAGLMSVLEYGRAVHAEMAALMDAARLGLPVKGCTLYTTTFPCHLCARHIAAAGLERVVYIEPYPKSLVRDLYKDSISLDGRVDDKVIFEPFAGVAPRLYLDLFVAEDRPRKDKSGRVLKLDKLKPTRRRLELEGNYLRQEQAVSQLLSPVLVEWASQFEGLKSRIETELN